MSTALQPFTKKLVGIQEFNTLTPYVQFAHPMSSKAYPKMMRAEPDTKQGDAFLVRGDNYTYLGDSFKFMHTGLHVDFFGVEDQTGRIKRACKSDPDESVLQGKERWKQFVESVILILHDGKIIPARCRFKGPKTNAIIETVKALGTLDDAILNDNPHLADMPNTCWLITTTSTEERKSDSGNPYEILHGECDVTDADTIKYLKDNFETIAKEVDACRRYTVTQLRELEKVGLVIPKETE